MKQIDADFAAAVQSRERVSGLTHNFYRYPARFSPLFVRAAIQAFTEPGDTVLDPFMGGGTTLVEASAAGRLAVGTDINSLSVFVSRVKTTVLSEHDLKNVIVWADTVVNAINLHKPAERDSAWLDRGYQRNIDGKTTWPVRKIIEMALPTIEAMLVTGHQRNFAHCALLKTAQWALDCRREIPSAGAFRRQLLAHVHTMVQGRREFGTATQASRGKRRELAACLQLSAAELHTAASIAQFTPPRLVVTSPPYPGVHVLYHRWQVQGRRETPAPYWIAASYDGDGASFYNFGDRHQRGLTTYYQAALAAFASLAKVVSKSTMVVQMIAFADPSWQLPEYLATMAKAGFSETTLAGWATGADGRLWRTIPNRKFYADQKGATTSSKEVVLIHRLR